MAKIHTDKAVTTHFHTWDPQTIADGAPQVYPTQTAAMADVARAQQTKTLAWMGPGTFFDASYGKPSRIIMRLAPVTLDAEEIVVIRGATVLAQMQDVEGYGAVNQYFWDPNNIVQAPSADVLWRTTSLVPLCVTEWLPAADAAVCRAIAAQGNGYQRFNDNFRGLLDRAFNKKVRRRYSQPYELYGPSQELDGSDASVWRNMLTYETTPLWVGTLERYPRQTVLLAVQRQDKAMGDLKERLEMTAGFEIAVGDFIARLAPGAAEAVRDLHRLRQMQQYMKRYGVK